MSTALPIRRGTLKEFLNDLNCTLWVTISCEDSLSIKRRSPSALPNSEVSEVPDVPAYNVVLCQKYFPVSLY